MGEVGLGLHGQVRERGRAAAILWAAGVQAYEQLVLHSVQPANAHKLELLALGAYYT